MKIIFVCSSLELGKDGVGDYTRRLAGELIRQGHNVGIVALHDSYIDNFQHEIQIDQNSKINTLRLSSCIPWRGKKQRVKKFIDDFDSEWLSLQFVPYGFHKKGLPFLFPDFLVEIGGNRKWHIMFHELWIIPFSIKHRIIAQLQKKVIFLIVKKIAPIKITTSILFYKERLCNLNVEILPLFGNIPLITNENLLLSKDASFENIFKVIHFGSFSEDELGFKRQIERIVLWANSLDKNIDFFICGRSEELKRRRIDMLVSDFKSINVIDLDFQSPEQISKLFSSCDLGISRANALYAGKSGTTQAMIEHGLPVLLRDTIDNALVDSDFYYYIDDQRTYVRKFEQSNLLELVANKFLVMIGE